MRRVNRNLKIELNWLIQFKINDDNSETVIRKVIIEAKNIYINKIDYIEVYADIIIRPHFQSTLGYRAKFNGNCLIMCDDNKQFIENQLGSSFFQEAANLIYEGTKNE